MPGGGKDIFRDNNKHSKNKLGEEEKKTGIVNNLCCCSQTRVLSQDISICLEGEHFTCSKWIIIFVQGMNILPIQ